MKKGDLALAAAERMAGRGWLPQPLRIGELDAESGTDALDDVLEYAEDEAA